MAQIHTFVFVFTCSPLSPTLLAEGSIGGIDAFVLYFIVYVCSCLIRKKNLYLCEVDTIENDCWLEIVFVSRSKGEQQADGKRRTFFSMGEDLLEQG